LKRVGNTDNYRGSTIKGLDTFLYPLLPDLPEEEEEEEPVPALAAPVSFSGGLSRMPFRIA
jgi:hypothetical protein